MSFARHMLRARAAAPAGAAMSLATASASRQATTAAAVSARHYSRRRETSTADAVTNIIYKTPTAQKTSHHNHVLNCFMQDEPGILTRATGIMAARGYNIDSVVVSRTEIPGLSRMTIVVKGEQAIVQQARKQLEDLPQVWAVVDLSDAKVVEREILLIKLSTLGPEHMACSDVMCTPRQPVAPQIVHQRERELIEEQHAAVGTDVDASAGAAAAAAAALPHVQVVESSRRLAYIRNLANMFGAKVVDVGAECCIVELCAKSERVDAFMKIAAPFGILEAARSGRMAMSRTAKLSLYDEQPAEEPEADKGPAPDLSNLPPS
ncbi:acetolactate synthase, regulatory subunit [Coemansia interrupta]|uniref:Acetolactate synthase, regulatory subunit n=1 Tax=Coemansia interrupta TaxID=1126814 RepID=A0A9W8H857_9FUNG|nr:acetolactate synthase, regulatory subunit [Coemansia interrupta]